MTGESIAQQAPSSPTAPKLLRRKPRYSPLGGSQTFSVRFGTEEPCLIEQGRQRAYPGLVGPAPCTRSVYTGFAKWLQGSLKIWDIGCGSGTGTFLLTERGHQAIGFDVDEAALQFAQQYFPEGEFRRLSITTLKDEPPADVLLLVDVLGFCDEPRKLLWELRQVAPNAQLLLAEPRATPGQSLVAPQRQAFSMQSLRSLLLRAGYRVVDQAAIGTFITVAAAPSEYSTGHAFERAFQARSSGAYDAAILALEPLVVSESSEVARAAHLELAELFAEKRDGDSASANYLSVLQQNGDDADALSGLSQLSLASGNPQAALELALRSVEQDPCSAAAACSLGLAAEFFSTAEAFRAWQLTASLAPAEPIALTRLAELASAIGHSELAIRALERLRHYHPEQDANFYVTLSWLLLGAGRTQDAKLEAQLAGTLAPESPEVRSLQERIEAMHTTS